MSKLRSRKHATTKEQDIGEHIRANVLDLLRCEYKCRQLDFTNDSPRRVERLQLHSAKEQDDNVEEATQFQVCPEGDRSLIHPGAVVPMRCWTSLTSFGGGQPSIRKKVK